MGQKEPAQNVNEADGNWIDSIIWFFLNNILSTIPSQRVRIFFLRVFKAKIGAQVAIYGGCEFRNPAGLSIGSGSSIGHRSLLDARRSIVIGENVTLATEVMIWSLQHDYNDVNFSSTGGPIRIDDFAWLGSRCIVLPNITIGRGAVVAAGAVVTKDVMPFTVVGGIPAKMIAKREALNYAYVPGKDRLHMV